MYVQMNLIGYVGHDPDLAYLENGTAVAHYSVAVQRRSGDSQRTMWVQVSSFGRRAEADHQHLRRGDLVYLEGRPSFDPDSGGPRIWQKASGQIGSHFEVTADRVVFLTKPVARPANGQESVIVVEADH